MNNSFWKKIQSIDPRYLYVVQILAIAVPLLLPSFQFPAIPSQQTIDAFNTVEAVGHDGQHKMVILDGWWSASTRGEQQYQTEAIVEHVMRLHMPFAILSGDPQNRTLMESIADRLAPKYNYVYGRDYVNWGYKVSYAQTLKAMMDDIPGTLKEDANGKELSSLPVMKGVKTMADVGLIFEITPSSTIDTWLSFVEGKYHTPIIYAPTAVMAPEAYPFLDSGQIKGLILGVKGAGDYEQLLHVKGAARTIATAMSMVYVLIILLIVVGNVGHFAARRASAVAEESA